MKINLPDETEVEVVMRKTTTIKNYKAMISTARKKGWTITAYQKGFTD